MSVEALSHFRRARRAYELGRLRSALLPALILSGLIGGLGLFTSGRSVLWALPVTLAAWLLAYQRGDLFLRGAWYGLLGGLVTSALPMSILRPCCKVMTAPGESCCTMPLACLGAGAVVGMVLALAVPLGKTTWWRTALGMVLGMGSVAVLKCATLFAGEAVGLVGGLLAGVGAVALAKLALRPTLTHK